MNNVDLFDQVENAVETKPEYATWGQCFMEVFEAVWPKGGSVVRFDGNIHKPSDKFTRIEITIVPLDEMNARYPTELKTNASGWNNRDWTTATLPSIKALNVSVRSLPGSFVKVVKKPNGKFYDKKKDGEKTGEKGELTDFLFVKVFESQDACLADYLEEKAGSPGSPLSDADFPAVPDAQPDPVVTPTTIPNETLLKFIRSFAVNAAREKGKDLVAVSEKVQAQIDANPAMKGKFTADMPEVMAFIAEACQ
jgi:hypothetical protein